MNLQWVLNDIGHTDLLFSTIKILSKKSQLKIKKLKMKCLLKILVAKVRKNSTKLPNFLHLVERASLKL